ncbi:MAG: hypothetical protein KIT84_06230 [Labilithrix sp.]|nr:hypothetical protein [Labilithrix sp.]MCW5810589.1 hypothetical protein [Labilithrix sp.]
METRTIAPSSNVSLATTTPRVTPTPPRAAKFGEVLANTAVRSAETAMRVLPGSPMMAVAVRGGATSVPLGTSTSALSASAPAGPSPIGASGATGASGAPGVPGVPGTSTLGGADGGIEASLQHSQDMNLYFLEVQQRVNAQNQSFTTLSNVMKAEHDTVKTAIGNIR